MIVFYKLLHEWEVMLQIEKENEIRNGYRGNTYQRGNGEHLNWFGYSANGVIVIVLYEAFHQGGIHLAGEQSITAVWPTQASMKDTSSVRTKYYNCLTNTGQYEGYI